MGMPMKQLPEYFTVLNPEADDLRFEPEVQLAATSGKLPRVVFPEYVDSVVVYFAGNVLYKVTYKIPLVYSDLSDELLAKLNLSRNGSRADCVELEKKIKSDAASRYVPTSAMFTDLLNLELTPGRTLNSAEIDTLGTAMVLKGAVAAGTRIVQVAGGIKAPAIYENHNGKDGVYWQLFRKGGLFVAMNGKGWERIGSPASSGGAVYRKWITVEHIWEPFVDAYGDSYSLMKVSELGNKWRKLLPQ